MGVIPSWRVVDAQPGGVVAPDERLRWGQTLALAAQHVIAMFGAIVLAPLLMGLDPNVAILMSGIGTLIFFVTVGGPRAELPGFQLRLRRRGDRCQRLRRTGAERQPG